MNNSSLSGTIKTGGGSNYSDSNGHSVTLKNFTIDTQTGLVTASAIGSQVEFLNVSRSTASKPSSKDEVNVRPCFDAG